MQFGIGFGATRNVSYHCVLGIIGYRESENVVFTLALVRRSEGNLFRVDQQPVLSLQAAAQVQFADVFGGEPLKNEVEITRELPRGDQRDRLVELANAHEQLRAPREARRHGSRVVVLALEPSLHLRVFQVLHVAIGIHHLRSVIVVGDGSDGSHWRSGRSRRRH